MSALFIAQVTQLIDPEKLNEYSSKAGPTVEKHNGEIIFRGVTKKMVAGENPVQAVAIMQFDSIEEAEAWYFSDDYQALIPIRNAAIEVNITLIEGQNTSEMIAQSLDSDKPSN